MGRIDLPSPEEQTVASLVASKLLGTLGSDGMLVVLTVTASCNVLLSAELFVQVRAPPQ